MHCNIRVLTVVLILAQYKKGLQAPISSRVCETVSPTYSTLPICCAETFLTFSVSDEAVTQSKLVPMHECWRQIYFIGFFCPSAPYSCASTQSCTQDSSVTGWIGGVVMPQTYVVRSRSVALHLFAIPIVFHATPTPTFRIDPAKITQRNLSPVELSGIEVGLWWEWF